MLERERGVVKNEKRQGENQPYGSVRQRMVETLYPYSHPYSWSTIGSMEDLDAASSTTSRSGTRSYYGPNNCVLSLAGDITRGAGARAGDEVLRRHPARPAAAPRRAVGAAPRRGTPRTMADRVPQTRVYRTYHVPGCRHGDADLLALGRQRASPARRARGSTGAW